MTRRTDRARRIWRSVNAWDFWSAIGVAAVACVAMLVMPRDLESTGSFATASITGGIALAGLDLVALRWVSDRMKDSAYGELVRARDRSEAGTSLPYWIVALSGMLTAAIGFAGALLDGELVRPFLVVYWTALVLSGGYALLGSFSLLRLTIWHQHQHALLQESRERAARERRRSQGGEGEQGDDAKPNP